MKRYIFGLVVVVVVALGYIIASYYSTEPIKDPVIAMAAVAGKESQAQSAHKSAEKEEKEKKAAQKTESADSDAPKQDNTKADDPNLPADPNSPDTTEPQDKESGEIQTADPNAPEDKDPMVPINLNDVEMKKIISKLAEWTGKSIIPTDEAMKIKITIYSPKEVRRSKALSYIYDALRMKGIIAEVREDRIFLKPLSKAKLRVPTLTIDEPLARIADRSMLVEKYFKVNNTSPAKLVDIIAPLTAEYGRVTAIESTSVIAVIDTVENLFRIKKIIDQFDVPESDQVRERVFEIKNGDPIEIVQVLQLILSPSSKAKKKKSGGKSKKGTASSVIIESGEIPTFLLPVPRQNWIIARASVENMQRIENWIQKLDVKETIPPERTIIPVKFVDVREVARLARNAIQEMPGSQLKTSVIIEEMPQAKQIVVFGSYENRKIIELLVKEIDLPIEDIYKTYVRRLKHADPEQVKLNIEALYEGQSGSFSNTNYRRGSYGRSSRNVNDKDVVKVVTDNILNSVSVIATEENLRKIKLQIEEWDQPIDLKADQYRIVTLHNSDPVEMVELLSTLFSETTERRKSFWEMYFGGGDDDKKKIVGNLYGLLTFKEVPGTKKILIISKVPEAYDVIEKLIKDLDSQEIGEIPRVITLNYADAEELCDQLNGILNESGTVSTIPRKARGLSYSADEESEGTTSNPNAQANSDPGMITPWWDRQRVPDGEMPTSNLIGKIRFVPVHRSKAILVLSPPEYIKEIVKMIEELDKPGMQVMIKAIIVEVDHASMTSLGVKLSSNPGAFSSLGTNAITALTQIAFAQNRSTFNPGVIDMGGGDLNKGFSTNLNINVLVDMLAKTINAKVLNQPTLWTKDNEEAEFFKGREISLIVSAQSDTTGTSTKNQFNREKVGVTLKIRPNITPGKDVDLTINLEISDLAAEKVNNQPVIKRLNTVTKLIVEDGQTILLGGILFQADNVIQTKVPLLGDLPILGGLFRHNEKELRNNELLIFITPHVIDGNTTDSARRHIEEPKERMRSVRVELDGALMPIIDKKTP
ncbi:MAG: hypothetical protein FVQ79_09235 [Planctomycetes bacterium]|nr:hypothetical protein [Planctomycetota bacterium]